MKIEIEARYLECDVPQMIQKLQKLGAKFVGDWMQVRNCYDFNPVNPNSWIRLRTNGVETTLTIKEIGGSRIDGTKEYETHVDDFEDMDAMLNKMGYVARSKQENRRIRYMLNGVEIDIDFWPMIPTYMEFEGDSEDDILAVCAQLGIDEKELTTLDVSSIYASYGYNINNIPLLLLEDDRKPEEDKKEF